MGMNANEIISDEMTLEEKLAAIDAAVKAQQLANGEHDKLSEADYIPADPFLALMCDGCQ